MDIKNKKKFMDRGSAFGSSLVLAFVLSLLIISLSLYTKNLAVYLEKLEDQFIEKIMEANSQNLANYPISDN